MARRSAKRSFGEISKLPSGRYRALYMGLDLRHYSAPSTFLARIDAEAWLAEQDHRMARGEWTPPAPTPVAPALPDEARQVGPHARRVNKAGGQKHRARPIEVLTVAQIEKYLAAVPAHRRVALMLAAWCGLRSGEVRGLRVCDLDSSDAGVVHVRQAVVQLSGRLIIGPTKTSAGIRTVTILPHLLPYLRDWLRSLPQRPREALLFTAKDGVTPLNDTSLREAHEKGKAAIGVSTPTIHGCGTPARPRRPSPAPPWPSSRRGSATAPQPWRCATSMSPPNETPTWQQGSTLATGRHWSQAPGAPPPPSQPERISVRKSSRVSPNPRPSRMSRNGEDGRASLRMAARQAQVSDQIHWIHDRERFGASSSLDEPLAG